MAINCRDDAIEQSTYAPRLKFTDEDGAPVTPNTILWTLTDSLGNIINGRERVPVVSMATEVNIVLSGDDLIINNHGVKREKRHLIIEATYNSSLGNDLPLNGQFDFWVLNLVYIDGA